MADWEGAVDPALAARLARPLVRPGITDPAHGRSIVRRLTGGGTLPLLGDLSRRYGTGVLEGGRTPIVHAVQRSVDPGAAASFDASSALSAPGGGIVEAERPVVRATERPASPAFPPIRPLAGGGASVQRSVDAGSLPVASARRAMVPSPSIGAPAVSAAPLGPVVSPAPSRLQRAAAADTPKLPLPARPIVTARRAPAADPAVRRAADAGTAASVGAGGAGGAASSGESSAGVVSSGESPGSASADGPASTSGWASASGSMSVGGSASAGGSTSGGGSGSTGGSGSSSGSVVQRAVEPGSESPEMIHRSAESPSAGRSAPAEASSGTIQRGIAPGSSSGAAGIVQRAADTASGPPRTIQRETAPEEEEREEGGVEGGMIQRSVAPGTSASATGIVQRAADAASEAPRMIHRAVSDEDEGEEGGVEGGVEGGTIQRSIAPGSSPGATEIVQRAADAAGEAPRMIHRSAATGESDGAGGTIRRGASPESIGGSDAPGTIQRSPESPPVVAARPAEGRSAAPRAPGLPAAGIVQRSVDPASAPTTGTVRRAADGGSPAVVAPAASIDAGGFDAGATQIHRAVASGETASAAGPASSGSTTGEASPGGGRRAVPVVAAGAPGGSGAAAGGVVQRAPTPGGREAAAPKLVLARPAAAFGGATGQESASSSRIQRQAASATPPPGAPPAELPTVTANGSAAPGNGADVGRLAEQVYDILVRRLQNERKQRGW